MSVSCSDEIFRCRLSGLAIGDDFVSQLLALVQLVHPGAFDRADVYENVFASIIRLNKAKPLVPLNHFTVPET
jgi:hypothetical protein